MKVALITGITGQDGSYLAELLLEKGYKIYGIVRRTSLVYTHKRLEHLRERIHMSYGDMADVSGLTTLVNRIVSENENLDVLEVYNLAAQSHVKVSFEIPDYTSDIDGNGPLRLLEIIKNLPPAIRTKTRFYQAGTSEMFGAVRDTPQNELTAFNPRSPYACSKLFAHFLTRTYREAYGIFAVNGILFNHESPRRGDHFVTKKVVNGVKEIANGSKQAIRLGNLDAKRDWGHAKDYVRGMWLMLQTDRPDDYVLATGVSVSVREFVEKAFAIKGIIIEWQGEGLEEKGRDQSGNVCVEIDRKYFRPCEVDLLLGDASKANKVLGWYPEFGLDTLIEDMFAE
tara:strand:+ start:2542 stop:3564 length:1023 start_codon:yes stop_codon:yes gene_type:complete